MKPREKWRAILSLSIKWRGFQEEQGGDGAHFLLRTLKILVAFPSSDVYEADFKKGTAAQKQSVDSREISKEWISQTRRGEWTHSRTSGELERLCGQGTLGGQRQITAN